MIHVPIFIQRSPFTTTVRMEVHFHIAYGEGSNYLLTVCWRSSLCLCKGLRFQMQLLQNSAIQPLT